MNLTTIYLPNMMQKILSTLQKIIPNHWKRYIIFSQNLLSINACKRFCQLRKSFCVIYKKHESSKEQPTGGQVTQSREVQHLHGSPPPTLQPFDLRQHCGNSNMIWRTLIIKAKLCSIPHKLAMATSNTTSIKERTKATVDRSFRFLVCLLLDSSSGCSLIGFPLIQQNWKTCRDCNNVHTNN